MLLLSLAALTLAFWLGRSRGRGEFLARQKGLMPCSTQVNGHIDAHDNLHVEVVLVARSPEGVVLTMTGDTVVTRDDLRILFPLALRGGPPSVEK